MIGSIFNTASDAAGSTYRCISIPSNARLESLKWQTSATLGSGCVMDVGVWFPTSLPQGGGNFLATACAGILISSSIFATALIPNAATSITDITNQSGNYLVPLQETPLWNVLGFVSDPEINFDIGFVLRAASASQGYAGLKATYQY